MTAPALSLLQEVTRRLGRGADDADAFHEDRLATLLVRRGGRLETCLSAHEAGLGLRRVEGEATSYATTTDPAPDAIAALAAGLEEGGSSTPEEAVPPPRRVDHATVVARDPAALPLAEKAALLERLEAAARGVDPRLAQVHLTWREEDRHILLVTAAGTVIGDHRRQISLGLRCIALDGALLQTSYNARGGAGGLEVLGEEEELLEWARTTATQAIRMLSARPAPAGRMTVVLAASAGGTMVHEAIGHGLEADLVQKGLSVYHGRVGRPVAAPAIHIVDDATLTGRRGFLNVDDEGSPGQRTVLVEDGILRGYLYDRLTARRDRVQSTGNGRRESFRHRPIVRMTNTMIAPGTDDPQAVIHETGRGLLVTRMGGGEVDTTTGNFVFKVNEAFLLEDGKVGAPVRGATLIGNGPKILEQIDRVGSDLGFDLGTCGKDGQGVPVADAQPTLRIPSITVGGERS
jgi:TldD protein